MLLTEDKFWQLWKGISETMFAAILKYKFSTQDQNRIKNMTHKRLHIFSAANICLTTRSFLLLPSRCCCQSHISGTNYHEVIKCARAFAFEANCRDVIQFQFEISRTRPQKNLQWKQKKTSQYIIIGLSLWQDVEKVCTRIWCLATLHQCRLKPECCGTNIQALYL